MLRLVVHLHHVVVYQLRRADRARRLERRRASFQVGLGLLLPRVLLRVLFLRVRFRVPASHRSACSRRERASRTSVVTTREQVERTDERSLASVVYTHALVTHSRLRAPPSSSLHSHAVRFDRDEQVPRAAPVPRHDADVPNRPVARRAHRRLHLHRRQHHERRARLDDLPGRHEHLHDLARHRRADGADVRGVAALAACEQRLLRRAVVRLVFDLHHARDAVHLEKDVARAGRQQLADRLQLDRRLHPGSELNLALFVDFESDEECLRGQRRERAVKVQLPDVIVEHGGVHRRTQGVAPGDQFRRVLSHDAVAQLREVLVRDLAPRSRRVPVILTLEHARSQRFREPARGLTDVPLEVLHDARGERQRLRVFDDGNFVQVVGDEELREVADHLRRRRDLHDVAQDSVRRRVRRLDLVPLAP
eukprot:31387-Pelagococcus_subviridis.AAC.7